MIAFDADVLSDIWSGSPELTRRAKAVGLPAERFQDFAIVVYAYAQEADMASNQVKAQIVKVAIKLNGQEIPVQQAL